VLLQGRQGLSRKGPDAEQASYYYSLPQLAVSGTLSLQGRAFAVTGKAWLDHEWSEALLHPEAVGWDWIGMNLDDGSALTAFRLRQDALTGLASREYLNDNAEGLVAALRAGGTEACILRIGVDGLDAVTQRYGAHAADQVLQQVAKRLRHLARERDIVMRLHGAEFALLVACPGQEAAAFARTLANRVLVDLKRPFSWRTLSNLRICGCVGSAVWPANGATLDEVMAYAEDALASARRSGPGQTRQFVEGFSNRFDPTAHPAAA
jgi:diguanylate cyclase (GGDEF)-like protein